LKIADPPGVGVSWLINAVFSKETAGLKRRWSTVKTCEIWLGRAGAGKTWGCLSAIADELRAAPRGPLLGLLVPEQATAQMERRLLRMPGVENGFTRARVFSFNHLAREALARRGAPPARRVGEAGRLMLLRRALESLRPRLLVFQTTAGQPGVAESVHEALLELQRYGWRPDDLEARLAAMPPAARQTDPSARKLADLALIWRDYERLLAELGLEDMLAFYPAAAQAIAQWPDLHGAHLWIDGFSSFTTLEWRLVEAVTRQAASLVLALACDPTEFLGTGGDRPHPVGPQRLFHSTLQTARQAAERFRELDWHVEIIALPEPDQPTRFAASPALAHIERTVPAQLLPRALDDADWQRSARAAAELLPAAPADAWTPAPIEIIEARDRRAEIEAIARRIVALCRVDRPAAHGPRPLTWRDIGLIARDLTPYQHLIPEVFRQFEIPFFLDRPRQIEGHPLCRLILAALRLLRFRGRGREVVHYLKTGLSGLDDPLHVAELENLILALDPDGRRWLKIAADGPPWMREIADRWRRAAAPLRRLEETLRAGDPPARALWRLLDDVRAAATLEAWIERDRRQGDEESALLHEQAWAQVIEWLEELDRLPPAPAPADADPMQAYYARLDDLALLADTALRATRARLIPPTLNQVTVGAVDRSRTPELKLAFLIGLNEQEFPRAWNPDPILGDAERDLLTRDGGAIGPDLQARRSQEHYLGYIALTRASHALVLTRPLLDDAGKAGDPSPFLRMVRAAAPQAPASLVDRDARDERPGLPLRAEEWMSRLCGLLADLDLGPARAQLAAALRAGHPLDRDDLAPPTREALRVGFSALAPPARPALDPDLAAAVWEPGARVRVTALERFAACPFSFFAEQVLRLQDRETAELQPVDLGSIRHDLLQRVFHDLRGTAPTLAWGEIDPAAADAAIERRLEQLRSNPRWSRRLAARALNDLTLAQLAAELKLFIRALRLAGAHCAFRQAHAEWQFGEAGELDVRLADGASFSIVGKVDRIDQLADADGRFAWLIFDYKSGRHVLDISRLMAGLDLQLAVYGLAFQQAMHRRGIPGRIAGIFYWPLAAPLHDAQAGDAAQCDPVDPRWFERLAPRGIFNEEFAATLDRSVGPGEASVAFGFRRASKGQLHGRGQAHWPAIAFDRLLRDERRLLRDLLARIARGEIAATPFRHRSETACRHCAFHPLCRRFEPGAVQPVTIPPMDRARIIDRFNVEPECEAGDD